MLFLREGKRDIITRADFETRLPVDRTREHRAVAGLFLFARRPGLSKRADTRKSVYREDYAIITAVVSANASTQYVRSFPPVCLLLSSCYLLFSRST